MRASAISSTAPAAVIAYIRTLPSRTAAKFAGHNPLGGISVVLILLCVLVQTGTGLFANDDILTEGPLYKHVSKELSDWLTTIHKYNFNVLLTLIGVHIGGGAVLPVVEIGKPDQADVHRAQASCPRARHRRRCAAQGLLALVLLAACAAGCRVGV